MSTPGTTARWTSTSAACGKRWRTGSGQPHSAVYQVGGRVLLPWTIKHISGRDLVEGAGWSRKSPRPPFAANDAWPWATLALIAAAAGPAEHLSAAHEPHRTLMFRSQQTALAEEPGCGDRLRPDGAARPADPRPGWCGSLSQAGRSWASQPHSGHRRGGSGPV